MAVRGTSSSGYYAAVYVCGSVLLVMLAGLLFYVLCSRRYRLNWFEKSQLEDGVNRELESLGLAPAPDKAAPSSRLARTQGTPESPVGEFWVPPSLQRQASVCQSDGPPGDRSGEDSGSATPGTPLGGVQLAPFTLSQGGIGAQSGEATGKAATSVVKHVQPPATAGGRPRVASMCSKLDFTKIDASMYRKQGSQPTLSEDDRGSVQFSVSYNSQFSLLSVQLIEAKDLMPRDFSGTADPYAKVRLFPDTQAIRQSAVHRKTLNPHFEEDFVFDVPEEEVGERVLQMLLFDSDPFSRHPCMGGIQLPLDGLDLSEKVTLWKGISPYQEWEDQPECGDLMFSLGYQPGLERLTVTVMKARNLPAAEDAKKSSDPYVKVALVQGGRRIKKKKTSTLHGTVDPVFNEALHFTVGREQVQSLNVEVSVVNENTLGQNEVLGRIVLGQDCKGECATHFRNMLLSKMAVAMWHKLVPLESA